MAKAAQPTYDRIVRELYGVFLSQVARPIMDEKEAGALCSVSRVLLAAMDKSDTAKPGQSLYGGKIKTGSSGLASMTKEQLLEEAARASGGRLQVVR